MKNRIFSYLTALSFIFLLPYCLTIIINGMDAALLSQPPNVEDYLPMIVARQIPEEYEEEAIRAQTVIARTNIYRRLWDREQPWEILTEMRKQQIVDVKNFRIPAEIYIRSAAATEGQVLTHEGELKLVPYHQMSSGSTRSGEEVFHNPAYSYLVSVDSSADKNAPDYLTSTYIGLQQLPKELKIRTRDSCGYVTSLLADGSLLEGEAFRLGMGLSSSDFSIQNISGELRFLCQGKGHGLGLSQYGGNVMAENGSTFGEILTAYFPAMALEHIRGIF